METERVGQALSAREIFELVREDLAGVEKAINSDSLASVETVTTIGRYLPGRVEASAFVPRSCCCARAFQVEAARPQFNWARWSR